MAIVGSATVISTREGIDAEGHQQYTTVYKVESDTRTESPIAVRQAPGMLGWGSYYELHGESNPDAWCSGISTDRDQADATGKFWLVTVTHSTKPSSRQKNAAGTGGLQTSPLSEPWKIGGSYATGTRVVQRNKDGDQLINSAFEPISYEIPDGYDTLTLSGPSATISLLSRAQAVNRVNSAAIWGLSTRMLFLSQWQYEILHHGSLAYVQNSLLFWIKYTLWNEKSYEMGTREYISTNASGKKFMPIIAPNDSGYGGKYYLDASGRKLSDADVVAQNFVEREDEVIPEFDFTSLGFPDPLPGPFV